MGGRRLFCEVGNFGRAELHTRGQFIRGNSRRKLAILGVITQMFLVQFREQVETRTLALWAVTGRRFEIENRIATAAKDRSLKSGRQKPVAPI